MNILVDELPNLLLVNGKEYEINTDFRYALSVILAFEDKGLTIHEKAMVMLQNIYKVIPEDIEQAVKQCQIYLNAGEEETDNEPSKRLYSFAHDGNLIYAAFRATHGVDLSTIKMHWWAFLSLFMDLGQNTTFCQLTSLRKRYYAKKTTPEENIAIREMGDFFRVPDDENYTLEELEILDKIRNNYKKAKGK